MKKLILGCGILLMAITLFAVDASAKDMSRRFGLGVDSALSDHFGKMKGISAIYNINRYFGMQLIFGVNTTGVKYGKGGSNTRVDWHVSLRGLIPFALSSDVNLSAVVGFTASGTANDGYRYSGPLSYDEGRDGYNFSIDLGVRPEWFVSEHFSLHTQVGLGISILTGKNTKASRVPEDDNNALQYVGDAEGVNANFFSNADLFGMAGFTFWF
ncbi:MAG: hypothetical protein WC966_12470 [Bradymonadales bacterium]|jgi:hypothetical protein